MWKLEPPRPPASIVFAVIVVQEADLPDATTMLRTKYATDGLSRSTLSLQRHLRTAMPREFRQANTGGGADQPSMTPSLTRE